MLRQRETPTEKMLWSLLRNRQLIKHKFLRQYPICVTAYGYNRYYIADFYCYKAKLIIEADGPVHLLKQDYDRNRDLILSSLGLTVLRFENNQILNDTQAVLNTITKALLNN